jgi:aspartyl-tRNA(Asn)/glutamyl-tRNA(Gln) amidotransferase subunit A
MNQERPLHRSSVRELRDAVASGERSAEEVTRAHLDRIRETDGDWNAFIHVADDAALAAAQAVDQRRSAGEPARALEGVPVAIKDQIVTKGIPTTAGSRMLKGFVPPYDATVVERLRAAGAIIIGKTNQDEFAMGSSNENSAHGPCANPWDGTRVPGGSSGGSAAAVAGGQVPLALGTDTGGSIRQPASLCGVVGLKPTYGRVSRRGAIAFASSLDQIGPLGRTVEDVALALEVLAGADSRDSTCSTEPVQDYSAQIEEGIAGLRVGLPEEYFGEGIEPGVLDSVREGVRRLEAEGAVVQPVRLPHTEYSIATYYLLATAEASSNLARYDGIRYGHRAEGEDLGLEELYAQTRAEGFGPEVRRRIMLGTFALSSGYYDAFYDKAQRVRTLIRDDFVAAFEQVDILATPTSPVVAFPRGSRVDDPLQMYLMDIFTLSASLAGLPGISVPCGFSDGLPVGLQLLAAPLQESMLLRAARAHERQFADAGAWPGEGGP